jgi:alcohol dehydrogenase
MVGVVHSLAHACGGVCHTPHGIANSILLPWGMENNLDKRAEIIAELAPVLGVKALTGRPLDDAKAAIQAVRNLALRLNELAGLPLTLKDAGVPRDKLEAIAKVAVNDGSLTYNPEDVNREQALEILQKAY